MKSPSDGAVQLYNYMASNYEVFPDSDNQNKVLLIFRAESSFWDDYKPYLDELSKAKWIHTTNTTWIVVGLGEVKKKLFNRTDSYDEQIASLKARYTAQQLETVLAVLSTFGALRRRGELTKRQMALELEYYSKFPIEVVVQSLQTYMMLDPSKQYGEQYARGIIRGTARQHAPTQAQAASARPSEDYEAKKKKQEWVRAKIDYSKFVALSPDQQIQYLESLEECYERQTGGDPQSEEMAHSVDIRQG